MSSIFELQKRINTSFSKIPNMTLLGMYITATDISIIMFILNAILFVLLLRTFIKLRRQE